MKLWERIANWDFAIAIIIIIIAMVLAGMVMLIVNAHPGEQRQEVLSLVEIFRARVVDVNNDTFMVELTGNIEKVNAFIELLTPIGILDLARTGPVAMPRIAHTKAQQAAEDEEFPASSFNEKV